MTQAPFYIIVSRRNQVLLSFMPLRVIINNQDIYLLNHLQPVVIPIQQDRPRVVITDGFHHSKPLELTYDQPGYFAFYVTCAITDLQLVAGGILLSALYLLGVVTGFIVLKALSFLPVVLFLFSYYFNRKNFLKVEQANGLIAPPRQ